TNWRQVGSCSGTEFEEHRLTLGQVHDRFHVVLHRLDETSAALRIFVLGRPALGLTGLAVIEPITSAGFIPDAIFVVQAHIEPYRRIKRAILVYTQPSQFVAKYFTLRFAKVTVFNTPIGNGPAYPVN